jgi:hypothetical protein
LDEVEHGYPDLANGNSIPLTSNLLNILTSNDLVAVANCPLDQVSQGDTDTEASRDSGVAVPCTYHYQQVSAARTRVQA